jgi:cytochrome c oxidase subunit 2
MNRGPSRSADRRGAGAPTDGAGGFQPAATDLARDLRGRDGMVDVIVLAIAILVAALILRCILRCTCKSSPDAGGFPQGGPGRTPMVASGGGRP